MHLHCASNDYLLTTGTIFTLTQKTYDKWVYDELRIALRKSNILFVRGIARVKKFNVIFIIISNLM